MAPLLSGTGSPLPPAVSAPLFIALAVLCVVWAVWAFRAERRYLSRAVRATGVVRSLTAERMTRGGTAYFPVISFTTAAGVPVTAQSKNSRSCRVGDSVPVLYDPDRPDEMQIDSRAARWSVVAIATFFAAIFIAIGAGSLAAR